MTARPPLRLLTASLVLLGLAVLAGWWNDGRAVNLPDAPDGRLDCVSYAPSGAGSVMPERVTPERIRADLATLASITRCVRTYTVSQGFDAVPAIAREFGLRVWLGAWIGREETHNERELARLIAIARRDRDVVRGIIVGNEVLLRHEQTPAALAAMIRRVREATGLPVSYADVWGRWLAHPELAREVSFVTVHILPYWDDAPPGIDDAIPRVAALYDALRHAFPDRPVLVGETGWPSAGRPRGAAVPSRVNQARYLREFIALAAARGIPFNLIEAFDQPWKQRPEGTVGGYWGLYDAQGRAKFPWHGEMREAPDASRVLQAAAAVALIAFIAALARGPRTRLTTATLWAAAGTLAVGAGARQWIDLTRANLTALDWGTTLVIAAAGWLAFAAALRAAVARCAHGLDIAAPSLSDDRRARGGIPHALAGGLLLAAAWVCLGLVFAGRHRDIPLWLFLPAAVAFVIAAWAQARSVGRGLVRRRAVEFLVLATWVALAGLLVPMLESFANARAIAFGASMLALGLAVLLPVALEARQHEGTGQRAER
ncbi:MAG: glycosyl hydrolase family 17 protein [Steroidobacteraceae bacterium]